MSITIGDLLTMGDEVIERSRSLARQVRMTHGHSVVLRSQRVLRRGLRLVSGGSDGRTVVDLIMERALCLACLVREARLSAERVRDVLTDLMRSVAVSITERSCDGCGRQTVVHRLG
jgi:hypothetical protein